MDTVSLARDTPAADLLPTEELTDCAQAVLRRDGRTLLSYGTGAGYSPLRELIAEWFGVHPFRVVLTNGWLQGFSLLVGENIMGRNIGVECPMHDRAQKALLKLGAAVMAVVIDEEGLGVDDFAGQITQYARPPFVYTMPNFQNPTGWTMTLARRQRVLEILQVENLINAEGTLLIENDSYGLTRFEGEPLPALFDLSGQTSVYSSSFSATIAPGLRVGWFIVPERVAGSLIARANDTYISPVLTSQAVCFEFLRRGSFEPHLVKLRSELKARRDAMIGALEKHFGGASWSRPEGGLFLWLTLPGYPDGREILKRAEGVTAVAGTEFGAVASCLRLSFASAAPDEIEAGIERLAAAV
ncbi:MAG: PLP-dependent aminotransferase family protein [Actinomycetes bacterium]